MFDITLPELSDISDRQNLEKVSGYLATLNEQLRYMMLNLDKDNLSDSFASTIDTAVSNSEKISWIIKDGDSESNFTLTDNAISLISDSVNINGSVSFSDLKDEGKSVINGANIMTGSISANKISAYDLSSISAHIASWKIDNECISSSLEGYGSLYLNSAQSPSDYWMVAYNADNTPTFSINKNGTCYIDGTSISGGSITADKIYSDTEMRLDFSNNYRGMKIGDSLFFTTESATRRIFVSGAGIMCFDTGRGNSAFSFALERSGSNYTLSLLASNGNVIGTIPVE